MVANAKPWRREVALPVGTVHPPFDGELLDGRILHWSWGRYEGPGYRVPSEVSRPVGNTAGMLAAFTKLRDAESVIDFATRYGTLRLCAEHRKPRTHQITRQEDGLRIYCGGQQWSDQTEFEPLERWLYYARQADQLVKLAVLCSGPDTRNDWLWRERRDARRRCWRVFYAEYLAREADAKARGEWQPDPPDWSFARPSWEERIEELTDDRGMAQFYLQSNVNDWLEWGDVRPRIALTADYRDAQAEPFDFVLADDTFGVLAVQLLHDVLRARKVAVCSACERVYEREIRRSQVGPADRDNYCSECGKRAAWRAASRRYRRNRMHQTE